MKANRMGNITGALAALLCTCGLVACTTTEADGGGTGGSGGATTTPVGSGGSTTPIGGATGGEGTLCPPPQQVITDFTYTPSDAGVSTKEVRFGSAGTLQGGQSYYPDTGAVTVDVTKSNYHISGTVAEYTGFGLYFDNCDHLDASQFKGIKFTISGSVPQGDAITMGVGIIDNTPTWSWLLANGKAEAKETDAGRCTPSQNTTNQYYHPGCGDPTTKIPVTSTPTQQTVSWANLTGGTPVLTPDPGDELTSIYWFLPWSEGGTPYAVDLVIDDLEFIP